LLPVRGCTVFLPVICLPPLLFFWTHRRWLLVCPFADLDMLPPPLSLGFLLFLSISFFRPRFSVLRYSKYPLLMHYYFHCPPASILRLRFLFRTFLVFYCPSRIVQYPVASSHNSPLSRFVLSTSVCACTCHSRSYITVSVSPLLVLFIIGSHALVSLFTATVGWYSCCCRPVLLNEYCFVVGLGISQ
jgi:hypothetical protein